MRSENADPAGTVTRIDSLSIIIPAFNEAENLPIVIDDVQREAGKHVADGQCEIIIVDDGSQDETSTVAGKAGEQDTRIVVRRHPQNRGLGAAIRTGYEAATMSYVCYFTADGQVPVSSLPQLIDAIGDADIVTTAYTARPDRGIRLLQSKVERLIIRMLFPGTPDIRGVPRFMKREVVTQIPMTSTSGFVNFELLLRATRNNLKIVTVYIDCLERLGGQSKVNNYRTIFKILIEMLKLRFRLFEK